MTTFIQESSPGLRPRLLLGQPLAGPGLSAKVSVGPRNGWPSLVLTDAKFHPRTVQRPLRMPCSASRRPTGFSLLELLIVVGIITILLGLLLPALRAVTRHSRRIAAQHETKMIEAAWKQYYATYARWPTNSGAIGETISGTLAAMLQGIPDKGDEGFELNPRRLRFVDFTRLNGDGDPVNPWLLRDGYYHVRFDTDFDGIIPADPPISNDVPRDVIVWTYNADRQPGDPEYVVGSWRE